MRYIVHTARSPKLILQLVLLLVLGGLIGGAGLRGLFTARTTLHNISSAQLPGLVHLLDAEREITQAENQGYRAVVDSTSSRGTGIKDIPQILVLVRQAWQNYRQFKAAGHHPADQSVLQSRVELRFSLLLLTASLIEPLGRVKITNITGGHLLQQADGAIITPLQSALTQLTTLDEADVIAGGADSAGSASAAAALLLGVILVTLALTCVFQVAMDARDHRARALAQQSADLVLIVDSQGIMRHASSSFLRALGRPPAELIGRSITDFIHNDEIESAWASFQRLAQTPGTTLSDAVRVYHADGSARLLEIAAVNHVRDPLVRGIVITARDVTARLEAEQALAFQATHDPLTGLPNRLLLQQRLSEAITGPDRDPAALLLLDLDRFKEINDTLGHGIGDAVLVEVGRRLAGVVRDGDLVARLGSDEFAIVLPAVDQTVVMALAGRLSAALKVPIPVSGYALDIEAGIGVALYPDHGNDAQTLLQHADVAMYEAKRLHMAAVTYDAASDQNSRDRLALLADLRQAFKERQLELYYQPKTDLATGALRGVEALSRWVHPTQGFIPPGRFILLAEQCGLIGEFTDWVVDTALAQCRAWRDTGHSIPVAVNISARTLHDLDLPQRLAELLLRHRLPADSLTLEITESSIIVDPIRARDVLTKLADLGMHLSIDDFGSGYTSLGHLKELPVHELKIDQSFVRGMGPNGDTRDAAIVRSVIVMAHALGLTVVAEGVEGPETKMLLAAMDCDNVQGYAICRPSTPADLERWLATLSEGTAGRDPHDSIQLHVVRHQSPLGATTSFS
jgi:diguanylate cyclase (GGDEF)-like protein/PAS domain S-box-containing protein